MTFPCLGPSPLSSKVSLSPSASFAVITPLKALSSAVSTGSAETTGALLEGPSSLPPPEPRAIAAPPAANPMPARSAIGKGAAAAVELISAISKPVQVSPYCAHQLTSFPSSNTRSLRPSPVVAKKFSMTTTEPSSRMRRRLFPSRSKRATSSGPIWTCTTLGVSSRMRFPSKFREAPISALGNTTAFIFDAYLKMLYEVKRSPGWELIQKLCSSGIPI